MRPKAEVETETGLSNPLVLRPRLFGGVPRRRGRGRESAYHSRALPPNGIYPNRAVVQLDEGPHDRQSEAGAAMVSAVGMGFEPVEHLVLDFARNARPAVFDGERDLVRRTFGRQHDRLARRREPDGIREQIEQDLADAAFIGHEAADVAWHAQLELDVILDQAVLHAFDGGRHGGEDVDPFEIK